MTLFLLHLTFRRLALPDPKEELETNSPGASSSNGRSSADSNLTRITESEKHYQANEYCKDDDARATYLTSSSKYILLRVLCLRFLSITCYFGRVSLWKLVHGNAIESVTCAAL